MNACFWGSPSTLSNSHFLTGKLANFKYIREWFTETFEGLGKIFEGNPADMLACADSGVMTSIAANTNWFERHCGYSFCDHC